MKIFIHSLGCDKNRVDGEKLAARLLGAGHQLLSSSEEAELVVVNTCGFIGPAKEESLDTVFSYAREKKVAVAGCLAERYGPSLKKELGEAELILGLADADATFQSLIRHFGQPKKKHKPEVRFLERPRHSAAIKIAEGCGNLCSYCAIPSIRGKLVSRDEQEIINEAEWLRLQGVQELLVVAQDVTAYQHRRGLPNLLRKLCGIKTPFKWIRLMYCHPAGVTDELIRVIADEPGIVKYLDLPLQHISDPILQKMNRHYVRRDVERLIENLRYRIPEVAIRTTFISGFPGETAADHRELLKFVESTRFDRMGAFTYSPEEGTRAFRMTGKVSEAVKKRRVEDLMYAQSDIIYAMNRSLIGKDVEILIDGEEDGIVLARTFRDAPEVDCNVIIQDLSFKPGTIQKIRIKNAIGLDLYA